MEKLEIKFLMFLISVFDQHVYCFSYSTNAAFLVAYAKMLSPDYLIEMPVKRFHNKKINDSNALFILPCRNGHKVYVVSAIICSVNILYL